MSEKTLTKKVGQRVLITGGKFHGGAVIEKVNPKNILVRLEATGQKVNAHPSFLSDLAAGAEVPAWKAVVEEIDFTTVPVQQPGALVRAKGYPGLFVVLADKVDKVNAAKIGGDGGRYYRFPRSIILPLSAEEFADLIPASVRG